jgi:hypothetical protein
VQLPSTCTLPNDGCDCNSACSALLHCSAGFGVLMFAVCLILLQCPRCFLASARQVHGLPRHIPTQKPHVYCCHVVQCGSCSQASGLSGVCLKVTSWWACVSASCGPCSHLGRLPHMLRWRSNAGLMMQPSGRQRHRCVPYSQVDSSYALVLLLPASVILYSCAMTDMVHDACSCCGWARGRWVALLG